MGHSAEHMNKELLHSVWVVEDNEEFRRQLTQLIDLSRDFRCEHGFRTAEPAIELIREGALPDIILMDIGLPGMSGIEAVRMIKTFAPSIELIMLTVFEEHQKIFEAITAGASGYLHKSSTLEEIVGSLKSILAGGAPINPHIAKSVLEMFAGFTPPKGEYHLSEREKEILKLLVEGLTKKEIAEKLFLSFHTIDNHCRNIYTKLRVQSRSSAVTKAIKERLL